MCNWHNVSLTHTWQQIQFPFDCAIEKSSKPNDWINRGPVRSNVCPSDRSRQTSSQSRPKLIEFVVFPAPDNFGITQSCAPSHRSTCSQKKMEAIYIFQVKLFDWSPAKMSSAFQRSQWSVQSAKGPFDSVWAISAPYANTSRFTVACRRECPASPSRGNVPCSQLMAFFYQLQYSCHRPFAEERNSHWVYQEIDWSGGHWPNRVTGIKADSQTLHGQQKSIKWRHSKPICSPT